jgi:pyruvate formate lyase activating enzyme
MATGLVFDIQRFSIHDGPGIRTTVFLKGCPLSCLWCHNPESQETGKDVTFYEHSGGGMTVSGGEPMLQFEFARDLLAGARAAGLHTCMETCGYAAQERMLALCPLVDLFLYDIKETDDARHREFTGVSNQPILANLAALERRTAALREAMSGG